MSFRPPRRRRRASLNVTSLIDVLFLLLIFFMTTSTFERQGKLELELPESTTASPVAEDEADTATQVALLADGTVIVNGDPTSMDQLADVLAQVRADGGERVLLNAEPGAQHGEVVRVLDLVREAGYRGVGIGTDIRAGVER